MNEIKTDLFLYNHLQFRNTTDRPELFMRHSHDYYEIIFFEKGDATYVIEDRRYRLKPNDLVYIRPRMYHYIEFEPHSEYRRVNIAFEESFTGADVTRRVPEETEIISCAAGSVIAENFERMNYYSEVFKGEDFARLFRGLLVEILYNMDPSDRGVLKIPSVMSPLLTKILAYINENPGGVGTIKDIADHFFIAESYLFKLFKTQMKISPKKYINMKRLLHVRSMIRGGQKPMEAFLESGFETYTGFYKQYKQTFGYPPSQEK